MIKTINGFISVHSIKQVNERTKVYNFEVEGFHTYLVGSAGLVVHNDCIRVGLPNGGSKLYDTSGQYVLAEDKNGDGYYEESEVDYFINRKLSDIANPD